MSPHFGAPETGVPEQIQSAPPLIYSLGIDLSLTGTGLTLISDEGIKTALVKSKGDAKATLDERAARLSMLSETILQHASLVADDGVIVIEQPAYSQTAGSHHDRSGLWWMIVGRLIELGYHVVEIAPTSVKKYACGKGNAAKDAVLAAVVKRYPQADVTDNNIADSLVLAAMGARWLKRPIDINLPVLNVTAMLPGRWDA